jgi:hypothetical protein
MMRRTVGLAITAFLVSTVAAQAGQHAVPRGGGSSSGSSGGGGATSSSGSSGGSTVSSAGDSGGHVAVPRHPTTTSSRGDGGGGGAASARSRSGGSGNNYDSANGAPPTSRPYRPQGDRPTTGYAVPRDSSLYPPGGGGYYPIYPSYPIHGYYPAGYYPYYSYYPYYPYYPYWGFGWGLGFVWDPFWFGAGGGYPDYGSPAYGGGSSGGSYAGGYTPSRSLPQGALRIKAKPREARVIVDGAVTGTVDDFDGKFQKLELDEGSHEVRLEAEGYEPLTFEIMIVAGQTVNYTGKLRKQ